MTLQIKWYTNITGVPFIFGPIWREFVGEGGVVKFVGESKLIQAFKPFNVW